MSDFITSHLLNEISYETKKIFKKSGTNGFIFFDSIIIDGNLIIDRINIKSTFERDKILPIEWYMLSGLTLIEIHNRLKEKKGYIPMYINNKRHIKRI